MVSFENRYLGTVRENITPEDDPDGHFWVDLYKTIPGAALDVLDSIKFQVISTPKKMPDGTVENVLETRSDLPKYRKELLVAAISDWNLTNRFEKRFPLAPEEARRVSIQSLPPDVYLQLIAVAERLVNESRRPTDAESRASFLRGGQGSGALGEDEASDDREDVASEGVVS